MRVTVRRGWTAVPKQAANECEGRAAAGLLGREGVAQIVDAQTRNLRGLAYAHPVLLDVENVAVMPAMEHVSWQRLPRVFVLVCLGDVGQQLSHWRAQRHLMVPALFGT